MATSEPETPPPPETIEGLFEALESPLLRYALRLLKDPEMAEDLVQQALVGLNVTQNRLTGEPAVRPPTGQAVFNYTQAEAKQLLERNTAEDNAVQMKLAERLIQQQDAAVASPAAIRATVPIQGRRLTFVRPLQVDTWADLRVELEARAVESTPKSGKLLLLAGVFLIVAVVRGAAGRPQQGSAATV
ncbi:MAG: hypothetical protein IPM17_11940 [Verrucomicrobia bacterium]|nr:hypothetical protein [Verrucomicrobiota bacterium]